MREEDFGSRLRALRRARGRTQAQLAAQSGVALRTILYWEAGSHTPGAQEMNSVVQALGLTMEEQQSLLALLPTGKAGKIARVLPALTDIATPPGVGDLIRALRWRQRMSRDSVAGALGVHRTTVRRWEDGRNIPNQETRQRLYDLLNALPAERAALMDTAQSAPLWNGVEPTLDICREATLQLEYGSMARPDALFDLRAHLLAGSLWNLCVRHAQARPLLAQTYAAHAAYACLRGDDLAAMDFAGRSLKLIHNGASPPETTLYRAMWASIHAATNRAPQSGSIRSMTLLKQWLPRARTSDVRASLLLSATALATQSESLQEARHYWEQTRASVERSPHSDPRFPESMQSVYADFLLEERRYDEALEVDARIASDLYQRQINRLIFQGTVYFKIGDNNQADSLLRRAYSLIETHQADHFRKPADELAAQLERRA